MGMENAKQRKKRQEARLCTHLFGCTVSLLHKALNSRPCLAVCPSQTADDLDDKIPLMSQLVERGVCVKSGRLSVLGDADVRLSWSEREEVEKDSGVCGMRRGLSPLRSGSATGGIACVLRIVFRGRSLRTPGHKVCGRGRMVCV